MASSAGNRAKGIAADAPDRQISKMTKKQRLEKLRGLIEERENEHFNKIPKELKLRKKEAYIRQQLDLLNLTPADVPEYFHDGVYQEMSVITPKKNGEGSSTQTSVHKAPPKENEEISKDVESDQQSREGNSVSSNGKKTNDNESNLSNKDKTFIEVNESNTTHLSPMAQNTYDQEKFDQSEVCEKSLSPSIGHSETKNKKEVSQRDKNIRERRRQIKKKFDPTGELTSYQFIEGPYVRDLAEDILDFAANDYLYHGVDEYIHDILDIVNWTYLETQSDDRLEEISAIHRQIYFIWRREKLMGFDSDEDDAEYVQRSAKKKLIPPEELAAALADLELGNSRNDEVNQTSRYQHGGLAHQMRNNPFDIPDFQEDPMRSTSNVRRDNQNKKTSQTCVVKPNKPQREIGRIKNVEQSRGGFTPKTNGGESDPI
jgi:hypothetical protein